MSIKVSNYRKREGMLEDVKFQIKQILTIHVEEDNGLPVNTVEMKVLGKIQEAFLDQCNSFLKDEPLYCTASDYVKIIDGIEKIIERLR